MPILEWKKDRGVHIGRPFAVWSAISPMSGWFAVCGSSHLVNDVHDQAGPAYEERQPGDQLCASAPVSLVDIALVVLPCLGYQSIIFKGSDTFFVATLHVQIP